MCTDPSSSPSNCGVVCLGRVHFIKKKSSLQEEGRKKHGGCMVADQGTKAFNKQT